MAAACSSTETIPRGKRIIEYKGKRTSWDDALPRPDSDPDDPSHTFLFEIDDGRVIDARVRGNAARWINHSCSPNCVTYEDDDGRVFIEAKRRIQPGEELTYDYRLSVDGRRHRKERASYAVPLRHRANAAARMLAKPAKPLALLGAGAPPITLR